MKPSRKTITITSFTVAGLSFGGVLLWLFNTLDQVLRAINLDQLPPDLAGAISALVMICSGVAGLYSLISGRKSDDQEGQ